MNIFYLDENPEICARFHNDKHNVKMIVESAQLLSTAIRLAIGVQKTFTSPDSKKSIRHW